MYVVFMVIGIALGITITCLMSLVLVQKKEDENEYRRNHRTDHKRL